MFCVSRTYGEAPVLRSSATNNHATSRLEQWPLFLEEFEQVVNEGAEVQLVRCHACEGLDIETHYLTTAARHTRMHQQKPEEADGAFESDGAQLAAPPRLGWRGI